MTEPLNNFARRVRFVPEITLGNLLQLGSIGAAVVAMWVNMDKRITAVEAREVHLIETAAEIRTDLKANAETHAMLIRTVDRISLLLEQHVKGGGP